METRKDSILLAETIGKEWSVNALIYTLDDAWESMILRWSQTSTLITPTTSLLVELKIDTNLYYKMIGYTADTGGKYPDLRVAMLRNQGPDVILDRCMLQKLTEHSMEVLGDIEDIMSVPTDPQNIITTRAFNKMKLREMEKRSPFLRRYRLILDTEE